MKKILKRLATGFLAFATIVTAFPTTAVHASEKQYWTESAERVGIIEKVMNDGSIREIVEHENSLPENEIRFYEYESGNELLKHTDILHELVFIDNLSHSGEWVLAIFASRQAVGIDVQEMGEISEYMEIAKNFFTEEEAAEIQETESPERFYQYWAAREAHLKALGIGLNKGMDFFSVRENKIIEAPMFFVFDSIIFLRISFRSSSVT